MKQSLQIKLGQQLKLTPQLQQAIRLLQLSSLDLHQEIQENLYQNPLLELVESNERNKSDSTELTELISETDQRPDNNQLTDNWNDKIPTDLPVDADWDDVYQPINPASPGGNIKTISPDQVVDFENTHSTSESLRDYLCWQLNLTPLSNRDIEIGNAIIDAVADDGFLCIGIEDIWQGLHQSNPDADIELDEVLAVQHRIQRFDPPGVASASLQESLLVQLQQLADETPHKKEAMVIVSNHLPLIGSRNLTAISRKTRFSEIQVSNAVQLIQTLCPKPGELHQSDNIEYIAPDVRVVRHEGRWLVLLNNDITPQVRINDSYAQMIKRADNSSQNQFLKENLQQAKGFLRNLESRNETILKVATCIIEKQSEFLEKGPEAMKPMVLAEIADQLNLHESTISRVTTQKFIDTPKGVFELKYFFSSHVNTSAGGQCSSTAIRAMLKKMIAEENPAKPLCDSKLATILGERGIQVARRTVAKYRESLHIPSSSERKRYRKI